MSLNVNNRLGDSLYEALLLLPATHPSTNESTTIGGLLDNEEGEIQKLKIREYINMFVSEIVAEFVNYAEVSIKMTEHTHDIPEMTVIGGGGGSVGGMTTGIQAVTDEANGEIEIGDPEENTGGID